MQDCISLSKPNVSQQIREKWHIAYYNMAGRSSTNFEAERHRICVDNTGKSYQYTKAARREERWFCAN